MINSEEKFIALYENHGCKSLKEFEEAVAKDLKENAERLRQLAEDWSVCDEDGLE